MNIIKKINDIKNINIRIIIALILGIILPTIIGVCLAIAITVLHITSGSVIGIAVIAAIAVCWTAWAVCWAAWIAKVIDC